MQLNAIGNNEIKIGRGKLTFIQITYDIIHFRKTSSCYFWCVL